ncbi:MAG: mechanosensitive ion channel family protein [Fidelibacterota bacterium]
MEEVFTVTFWQKLLENLMHWVTTELPSLLVVLVIAVVAFKMVRITFKKLRKAMIARAEKNENVDTGETTKRIDTLANILQVVVRIVLWAVFLMIILQKFGLNIGPIIAGAGIIGLAVGFGAQELVRDFISGFFIILENQIRTGDVAIIDGTAGLVEKIELRTITLRDFSGVTHIFPNGKISNISNMTKDWSAMIFDIGVAYKEDVQKVMDIMKQVGDELQNDVEFKDRILEPIEVFGLDKFDDSAIVIKARFKTKPIQQWTVGREYRKRLKEEFDRLNIEIPFPHTTVYWGQEINPLKLDVDEELMRSIEK